MDEQVSAHELWLRSEALHEKLDTRLRRVEIVLALVVVYASGQGGAALLSRFAG